MKFEVWMQELDDICCAEYGMSIYDLPDRCYSDAWEDGCSPQDYFDDELRRS